MSKIVQVAAALGFAAAAVFASSGAEAAPIPTSIGKIHTTAGSGLTNVQYRRWGGGGGWRWRGGYGWRGYGWRYPYRYGYGYGWGWGWPYYYGAGVVAGAAVAAPYYYAPPVYVAPAAAPPAATVSGAHRQCWVDTDSSRGYGYWRPC
jgi:hypothetical protein